MRTYRWVLLLGVGLCGCGVELSDPGTDRSAVTQARPDGGIVPTDAGVSPPDNSGDDAGSAYPGAVWPVQPPDSGYQLPIAGPMPDAGVAPPSYPQYPEYPPPSTPDSGTPPMPAPVEMSCSAVVWTFAVPYANHADFVAYYALNTGTDGSTTATCIVEHRAPPRNDSVAFSTRATVTAPVTQRTPDCSPESGWVFTRYANGIGVSYNTSNTSGSVMLRCRL